MKKKIIIVGGSKGIGKSISETLLNYSHVINLSRSPPDYEHDNLQHITCDVLHDNLPNIEEAGALVYCPGTINLKPITRLSIEDFKTDYEINVIGAVRVIQKYIEVLKTSEDPSVLLFSTVATKLGMPFHSSIAAAKSAVEGLTKSLGAEYATKVRFNAIAPTVTNTQLASQLLRNERMVEKIKSRHPLNTILGPENVAQLAAFLLSDKASTITGQVFNLDCGIVSFKL